MRIVVIEANVHQCTLLDGAIWGPLQEDGSPNPRGVANRARAIRKFGSNYFRNRRDCTGPINLYEVTGHPAVRSIGWCKWWREWLRTYTRQQKRQGYMPVVCLQEAVSARLCRRYMHPGGWGMSCRDWPGTALPTATAAGKYRFTYTPVTWTPATPELCQRRIGPSGYYSRGLLVTVIRGYRNHYKDLCIVNLHTNVRRAREELHGYLWLFEELGQRYEHLIIAGDFNTSPAYVKSLMPKRVVKVSNLSGIDQIWVAGMQVEASGLVEETMGRTDHTGAWFARVRY